MIHDLPGLIRKYRSRGILLDSNLLLLLFVGCVGQNLIKEFKRTANQGFTEKEFLLLQDLIGAKPRIITTPHILTETSNFIGQLDGKSRLDVLNLVAVATQAFKERRPEARRLVQLPSFVELGLTDSAVMDLPPNKYLVFSVDAALVIALRKKGVEAVNFNHLRQLSLV